MDVNRDARLFKRQALSKFVILIFEDLSEGPANDPCPGALFAGLMKYHSYPGSLRSALENKKYFLLAFYVIEMSHKVAEKQYVICT